MSRPQSRSSAISASTRPKPSGSIPGSRPPLESLIYALVPALAPPRRRDGRTSAASRPESRADDETGEKERREKVRELMEYCDDIMHRCASPYSLRAEWDEEGIAEGSRVPSTKPLAAASLPDAARRLLAGSGRSASGASVNGDSRSASRQNGHGESGADKALRFSGLWNKVERGRTLGDPLPHLQFLLALSQLQPGNAPPAGNAPGPSKARTPAIAPLSTFATPEITTRQALQDLDLGNGAPPAWKEKGKSKAQVLAAWRTSQSQAPFPTHLLLRDTLYLLQGIDGRYIRFALRGPAQQNPYLSQKGKDGEGAGFALGKDGQPESDVGEEGEVVGIDIVADEAKVRSATLARFKAERQEGYINGPTRAQLVALSEMGVMYRKITEFIQSKQAGAGSSESRSGMIEQSLCHFLHHELSEYHRLLAVLESQLSLSTDPPALQDPSSAPGQLAGPSTSSGAGLTLLRLSLWTEEMRMKLQMMSDVVDDAKEAHGGALVSRIHERTRHGDPFVRRWMDEVLGEVSKPFFNTLQKWIFAGELHDPFGEFFVQHSPDTARDGRASPYITTGGDVGFESGMDAGGGADEAGRVWEKKYVFVKGMVPGFVSEDFGKKIFSTGRSLNFIRYSCGDSDWIETRAKLSNAGRALKYSDLAGLEQSIDEAYSIVSQRLLEIFFDKFSLMDHLRALKSYLMLGAGDFAELLMDALAPRLAKPAISLYRHHLTSDLESAIRGSNAQYDSPDILRRLDARILEYSHGEVGWDCFALEYKVEAPLNAVLDGKAMAEYDRLFHHLWRLKRVEAALTSGWMRVTSGSRLFDTIPNLSNDWHHCRIVQSEMVHFLRQLQAYCQLEVIECSWTALVESVSKREGDLDTLIAAHRTYLSRVVRKVLLLGSKREREEILLGLVREALDYMLQFKDATDDLYAWCLGEATRLDRERDAERGIHSGPSSTDPTRSLEQLAAIRDRIRTCSNNFQDRIVGICSLAGSHSDLDVRFLAIRIAFNGHYSLRRGAGSSAKSVTSKSARG